ALVQQYEQRLQAIQQQVAELTERLNQNSTNSSRPPSSDPPHVKRRPPKPSSGRKRGGQPGHARRQRPLGRDNASLPAADAARWSGSGPAGDKRTDHRGNGRPGGS